MECDPINEEVGRGESPSSGVIWTTYQMLESIKKSWEKSTGGLHKGVKEDKYINVLSLSWSLQVRAPCK